MIELRPETREYMVTMTAPVQIDPFVQKFLSRPRGMLIGGEWVGAQSGKTFETYNPATGEVLAQVAEGDTADIDLAVAAARKAFESGPWPEMSPAQRGHLLWKLSDLIAAHLEELAELETLDNGKPLFFTHR
jgi:phenylacetaldehyde dehydrogenase